MLPRKKPAALVSTSEFVAYELSLEYLIKKEGKAKVVVGCNQEGQEGETKNFLTLAQLGGGWCSLKMEVTGSAHFSYEMRSATEATGGGHTAGAFRHLSERGHIALLGNGIVFRNIKLKPLETKPLFNGKDLTGWKKYEADKTKAKTQFTVTKEGWLDLRTVPATCKPRPSGRFRLAARLHQQR